MGLFLRRLRQYLWHRPKSWWRVLAAQLAFALRRTRVPVRPTLLDAEPTNHCNQRCPGCATGDGTLGRPRGTMRPEVFVRVMEAVGGSAAYTDLYCMGESFLNKHIHDYVRQASEHGIFTRIDTNGILVDPDGILNSGLDQVNFHISGTTQEVHDQYRRGGNLEQIKANVRKLVGARRHWPGSSLQIRLGMIVFRQNEHQIQDFYALARALAVDEAYLIEGTVPNANLATMGGMLTQIEDLNVYQVAPLGQGELVRKRKARCSWPWHGTSISWNGDVHPCCHDYYDEHKVGNVLEEDFARIWNGEKLRAFRRRLLEGDDIPMCRQCPGYGVGVAADNLTRTPPPQGEARIVA
ncbi:MAG: radical SAM/SPASM domain-containing protein [Candidatus Latescibacterota bacterium]